MGQNNALRPELIFGLIGPAGVRLDDLSQELDERLHMFGYTSTVVRLSSLLERFAGYKPPPDKSEGARIRHGQAMGNAFRKALGDGAALALAGIVRIREIRKEKAGGPSVALPNHAFILHQLKHPAEVELLRSVFGPAFFLVAGHAPLPTRVAALSEKLAALADLPGQGKKYRPEAEEIIAVDDKQEDEFGQNTRDTYPKADFFANLTYKGGEKAIKRYVDLLFHHPLTSPRPEEVAMYQAHAASLRSADFSRQVGAAIVERETDSAGRLTNLDIVATGMNEVPRGGGGYYWDGDSPDVRDQALLRYEKADRAKEIKVGALVELIDRMKSVGWFKEDASNSSSGELARGILPQLRRTQFMEIGEFMRPVHAEMAALIDAARRGVPVQGRTMFVTTFPCHNCAKHIIAAGIRKVVYLEPYPKSRADFLHGEEISLDSLDGAEENAKVVFTAFTGIAPRQYARFFSMAERGGTPERRLEEWDKNVAIAVPHHFRNAAKAYMVSEGESLTRLDASVYPWDAATIVPI